VIPYRDENETQRTPVVTFGIIGLCVLAWFMVQGAGSEEALATSICNLGFIPAELFDTQPIGAGFRMSEEAACLVDGDPAWLTVFTSMFLHGSWMHIIGNMWFMWVFGNNIEDSMTRARFVVFYLVCGVAAALAQGYADTASIIPMVGASGAISGVMGGYLVLYPRVRVWTLVPLGPIFTNIALPAWVMLIYWSVIQIFGGLQDSLAGGEGGGVAFWAHIGGFVAGVVLIKVFARPDAVAEHRSHHWEPRRQGWHR